METLGLKQAVEILDNTPGTGRQLPGPEMLGELLSAEFAAWWERYLTTRTHLAHLSYQHTMEQFDFGFQLLVGERLVEELTNWTFVAEATNILMQVPLRVGKIIWQ